MGSDADKILKWCDERDEAKKLFLGNSEWSVSSAVIRRLVEALKAYQIRRGFYDNPDEAYAALADCARIIEPRAEGDTE